MGGEIPGEGITTHTNQGVRIMERITQKMLEAKVDYLNRITGNPRTYSTDGKSNIGHYHITYAYGGANLAQTTNNGGGIRNVCSGGHITKRDLYERMTAYEYGLQDSGRVTA